MTFVYTRGLDELRNWETDTFKCLLVTSGYTPDRDHDYVDDVVPASNEITGAGYTRQTVANAARTIDDANDRIVYDADDFDFGSIAIGETVAGVVLYREVTNDSDSILIAYYSLGSIATTGNPFPVAVPATGMIRTQDTW